MPSFTVARLAELCEGKVDGDPQRVIGGANTLENADETELAFAANRTAFTNGDESSNVGGRSNFSCRCNHRSGMNGWRAFWNRIQLRKEPRKC